MATNLVMSVEAVNAEANALGALLNNGYARIYDGAQPASPDSAITTQTLLAELRFGDPAFGDAVGGVISAGPIAPDEDAKATGIATWARFLAADETPLFDGAVDVAGALLNFNSVSIQQHAVVSISAYQHTIPRS